MLLNLVFCETFLFDGINDGVCIYLRNTISFKTCLKFSNSVCDLLIVSLQTPSLIIILVYGPPSCPVNDFEEISLKIHTYVMSLPPPLPNIILRGDFNLPEINWSSIHPSCPTAGSLLNLTSLAFLNQKVSEPTRNCNILDLIFFPDNIINFITVSDTFLSDHRIIYAETFIPVHAPSTVQIDQNLNPSSTRIEILRFNKSNWPKFKESLNTNDWLTIGPQYLARCLEPGNVYHSITTRETPERRMKVTLFTRHRNTVGPMMLADNRKATLQAIHTDAVNKAVKDQKKNMVLDDLLHPINDSEKDLTMKERATLAQLRSGFYKLLCSYKSRIKKDAIDSVRPMEQTGGIYPGMQLSRGGKPRLKRTKT